MGPKLTSNSDIQQQGTSSLLDSYYCELSPAIELREVGKYKEAQEWLNEFIPKNTANPDALSLLSQILMLDKRGRSRESAHISCIY